MKIILILFLAVSLTSMGQSDTQYKPLLKIELEHDYFKSGYDPSILIKPSISTFRSLKDYGLLVQQKEKWMTIYAPDTLDLNEFILENDLIWQFECKSSDALFLNYTDMGIYPGMRVFSNENLNEGSTYLEAKLISTETIGKNAATIDIHLNNLFMVDTQKPIQYQARFKSRKTSIRYYIINNKPGPITLELEGELAYLFNDPMLTELSNGDEAYLFDSGDNLFPLRKYPSIDLSLNLITDSNKTTLIQNLPSPRPEQITTEGQKNISPIYVSL